jgi:hypothetical protein
LIQDHVQMWHNIFHRISLLTYEYCMWLRGCSSHFSSCSPPLRIASLTLKRSSMPRPPKSNWGDGREAHRCSSLRPKEDGAPPRSAKLKATFRSDLWKRAAACQSCRLDQRTRCGRSGWRSVALCQLARCSRTAPQTACDASSGASAKSSSSMIKTDAERLIRKKPGLEYCTVLPV